MAEVIFLADEGLERAQLVRVARFAGLSTNLGRRGLAHRADGHVVMIPGGIAGYRAGGVAGSGQRFYSGSSAMPS